MALFDLSHAELQQYRPKRTEPADFDAFWAQSLADARAHPLDASFEPVDAGLVTVESYDVTFAGYGGQPVKGWLLLPAQRHGPLPCVIQFIGYSGGRSFPFDWLVWSSAGYAHFVMDTRGQGFGRTHGDTPDRGEGTGTGHVPGFMTQGILDPATYYYRRVFVDGVRAVAAAQSHQAVDPGRVAVAGASQGGGISLAVAGLLPDDVHIALVDVPFLCHFRRATELVDTDPYQEISRYCRAHRDKVDTVFRTLSYFDGVNFAPRARAGALFSVGLMDAICPPSTVYAAYNHYAGQKEISAWPYNGHEGGGSHQTRAQLGFMRQHLPT